MANDIIENDTPTARYYDQKAADLEIKIDYLEAELIKLKKKRNDCLFKSEMSRAIAKNDNENTCKNCYYRTGLMFNFEGDQEAYICTISQNRAMEPCENFSTRPKVKQ